MRAEQRDAAYLWDMLEAARMIVRMTTGVSQDGYRTDEKLRLAVERGVSLIGEAARRVSESFRKEHPEVPWRKIIAQRNVVIHEYGEIDHERLWIVAIQEIPLLIEQLAPLIPPLPGE